MKLLKTGLQNNTEIMNLLDGMCHVSMYRNTDRFSSSR